MTTKTFRVVRQHLGDRMYMPGEERQADSAEVAHLVEKGVLEAVKAESAPKNKAAKAVKNKDEGQ